MCFGMKCTTTTATTTTTTTATTTSATTTATATTITTTTTTGNYNPEALSLSPTLTASWISSHRSRVTLVNNQPVCFRTVRILNHVGHHENHWFTNFVTL